MELKREIGNISPFVNGKSMSQLRSDKKKKRKMSNYAENCYLKNEGVEEDNRMVTPSFSSKYPQNKRWYNKNLMDDNSVKSPSVSTLTYIKDIDSKRLSELKKKE